MYQGKKFFLFVLAMVFCVAQIASASTVFTNADFSVTDLYDDNNKIIDLGNGNVLNDDIKQKDTFTILHVATTAVPLPGALMLLAAGFCRLAAYIRRRKE